MLRIFFRHKTDLEDQTYRIGVQTSGKNIRIKKVVFPDAEIENNNPQDTTDWISNRNMNVRNLLTTVDIYILFDPNEIGLREEIDVIIYDNQNNEIVRYDPFISGFPFRQKLTMNTNAIGLSGDVTADHSIAVMIDSSNINFWANETHGDGNGITFSQSDETTEYDFDIEQFNSTSDDALFWVEVTETFDSTTDLDMFIYYGGSNVDNSDGNLAYPSNYELVVHGDSANDSTENNITVTPTGDPTFSTTFSLLLTGFGIEFDGSDNLEMDNGGFPSGIRPTGTIMSWVVNDVVATANPKIWRWDAGLESFFNTVTDRWDGTVPDGAGSSATMQAPNTGSITQGTAFHFVNTWATDGNGFYYLDGLETDTDALGSTAANFTTDLGYFSKIDNTDFVTGKGDELKVFSTQLSSDEIKIIFHSEDNNFITFSAEQTPNEVPNININVPNATGTQIKGGAILVIDFNVSDADNNSLLIDLNFSGSTADGTGTVIINDVNTDTGSVVCDNNNFSTTTNCTFSWTTPTTDGNFFMLAKAIDSSGDSGFDAGDNNFMIDSTAPIFVTILPDVNVTQEIFNLDFNATIDDSVGSGNFRCITRVFFNDVVQGSLDLNVDGTTGLCTRSINSGVPNDTNVSIGFRSVDTLGNVSDENISQKIFFSPPPLPLASTVNRLCSQISDDLAVAGGCIDDDGLEDTITSAGGLFILEGGDTAGLLLLFIVLAIGVFLLLVVVVRPKLIGNNQ